MKKINKWIITFVLIFLPTYAFAINRIYLPAVDGTPPVLPPAPSSGSLLTTSGVYASTIGTIWGTAGAAVKKSTDGITFTATPTNPPTTPMSIAVLNTGRIIVSGNTSNPCSVYYSDNLGNSWTTVTIPDSSTCTPINGQPNNLKCAESTCYLGGSNPGALPRIYKSTDDGVTWTASYTPGTGTAINTPFLAYYDGTVIIGVSIYNAGLGYEGAIITSINNGISWNVYQPGATILHDAINATKFGNTYYVYGRDNVNNTPHFYKSTDLITWTKTTPTFTPGTDINGAKNPMGFYGANNYNPPTLYFIARNSIDSTSDVYASTDGNSFTRIYQSSTSAESQNRFFKIQ